MSIEIYWISGSAPAWRVLLTLEAKGLDYVSHILQTSKKEQKEPWFLALNPRGQIPLLRDNGVVVSESLAIMHYLEKRHPEPPLFGIDPPHTAIVEQTVHEVLSYVDKSVTGLVQPVFRGKVAENRESLGIAADDIKHELRLVNDRLANQEWLAGSQLSAADIVLIPTMQRLYRAITKENKLAAELGLGSLDTCYPDLDAWNNRVEALPAFAATFPPHWRD